MTPEFGQENFENHDELLNGIDGTCLAKRQIANAIAGDENLEWFS